MKLKLLIVAVLFLLLSRPVYAQNSFEECLNTGKSPTECEKLFPSANIREIFGPAEFFGNPSDVVNALLSNVLLIAGIILFLLVVVAGFQMIQAGSSGDPHAMEKWRTMLMYGIIGFAIILVAGGVIKIIELVTGVNILDPEAVLRQ